MNNYNVITLAMTGASGMPYGLRLLECLLKAQKRVYFTWSSAAKTVMALENTIKLPVTPTELRDYWCEQYGVSSDQLEIFTHRQWDAPIASGSSVSDAMVICPCSSGCVAAIAAGMSDNLIERAADVTIKEKRPLILVHRETPLSVIHLENLLKLSRLGVTILPANPGFYHNPKKIEDLVDFVVARILNHLNIPHTLQIPWGSS